MTTRFRNAALLVGTIVLASCSGGTAPSPPERTVRHGIDLAGMDRSVAPGDDFFDYANGTWTKTTAIPPDRAGIGTFTGIAERTEKQVAALIQHAATSNAPAGSDERKIGDTYASFMDETAIEKAGAAPLRPILDRISAIASREDLARTLGSTLRADVDAINATTLHTDNLFGLWVAKDMDDPERYAPFLLQGGLGMPDRAYYLDSSPRMEAIRKAYRSHVAATLKLAGVADPDARAGRIVDLEHRIAEAHWSREDSGDVKKCDNHWSRADFPAKAPGLDWDAYFAGAGLGDVPEFVVWQPGAFTGISALVASQPLQTWKDYLTYHAVAHFSAFLPKAFVEEAFDFNGKTLMGTTALRERWKRGVDVTDRALGDAVGKLYVARYFPPSSKTRARKMVENILAAFRRRIDALDWMAPETKAKAKAKLGVLIVGVGYPDHWRDYAGLTVVRGDAFGNAVRSELFRYHEAVAKLGKPVDRTEWVMTPQTVNAVNLPVMNALNFPAAILQPPAFDPDRPEAMDYGAIGAVIGHEISHSFDDQGALFDAEGRLRNWWTPADFRHFEASAQRLVKQYDAYRPFPDLAVNGELTLGENIADVAGLSAAHDAWELSLHGKPAPEVEGLTGEQQFFLSFAQFWRSKMREAALRRRLITNEHAPPRYRADTVRNLDAWYPAFGVEPGQALYLAPGDRVRVW